MSVNPNDLLEDGFPHGTLEGERAGCVTSNCPGAPLTCAETASAYRTDMGFRKLYQAGARGADLVTAWEAKRTRTQTVGLAEQAGPATSEPEPEPEPAAVAVSADGVPEALTADPDDVPVFVTGPAHSRLDDIEGPQVRQLWVLLDENKGILLAAVQPEVAVAALAAAWREYLVRERA